jgi:hypothetical protein
VNNERPIKAGVDIELETAANRLLKDNAAASAVGPIEKVLAHSCGLIGPCGCKKWITIAEAEELVRLGQADWLSDSIRGMANPPDLSSEKTYKAVVYRRGTRSPRATVTGAPHITNLTHFKNEEVQLREILQRAILPENEKLIKVVETWPEYGDLEFENDEYIVWVNVKPYWTANADLFGELAHELHKSADEVKHLFEQAEEKIQKYHRSLIKRKAGVYASWKNMPDDFNLLPVKRMLRTLNVLKRVTTIPEFMRLTNDQRTAIRVYVDARLSYRDAASRANIPENTIRDRVQAGYSNLGKMREKGNLSVEFKAIQINLFGNDIQSSIRSAQDREGAMENRQIAATGGGPGSRIVSRGTRIGAGGQRLQRRLDTYENSEFTIRETDEPREHEASGRKLPCVEDDYDN